MNLISVWGLVRLEGNLVWGVRGLGPDTGILGSHILVKVDLNVG